MKEIKLPKNFTVPDWAVNEDYDPMTDLTIQGRWPKGLEDRAGLTPYIEAGTVWYSIGTKSYVGRASDNKIVTLCSIYDKPRLVRNYFAMFPGPEDW